jgi:pyruvate/2-oxoacid:ferredoxin oxidoreductase alpha subunit
MFLRHRQALEAAMREVAGAVDDADRAWRALTGRTHGGVIERYRCEDASTVIVTMGSLCGTVREAVDALRDAGARVGLVKVRLFRPLPVAALRAALGGRDMAIVLDRNHSPGHGGVLHQELLAALYGLSHAPRVHGFLAGVGGVNVPPHRIVDLVQGARTRSVVPGSIFVE